MASRTLSKNFIHRIPDQADALHFMTLVATMLCNAAERHGRLNKEDNKLPWIITTDLTINLQHIGLLCMKYFIHNVGW